MRRLTELDFEKEQAWLATMPKSLRPFMQAQLRQSAHWADLYRQKFEQSHPIWGVGTLWSVLDRLKGT